MHFNHTLVLLAALIGSIRHISAAPTFHEDLSSSDSGRSTLVTHTVLSTYYSTILITTTRSAAQPPRSSSQTSTCTKPQPATSSSPARSSTSTKASPSACSLTPSGAKELSVPTSWPTTAVAVPGDFLGFGFETAFLPNYATGTFSENLINSVAKRLSLPVIIRIGGTGGDKVVFDPDQDQAVICVEGDCPVGFNAIFSLGPTYFDAFERFQNQQFTFQAPMRPRIEWSESIEYVKRAYEAAGAERVAALALGNEVDLFEEQYNVSYSVQDYVENALELEQRITNALDLSASSRIFEVLDTTAGNGDNPFSLPAAFRAGIDLNNRVKYAAQHWYQSPTNLSTYGPDELQTYLMNHSAITSLFATGYSESVAYLSDNADPAVQYIISESGSSLAGPPLEYQATFGACLWAVDFMLYGMSQDVKRIDLTQRPATWHSLWVPDNSTNDPSLGEQYNPGPQVRGPWFAMPMLADFVGTIPGAVVELLGEDTLTAYAMLDQSFSRLSKVAILNMNFWTEGQDGSRPVTTFTIPVGKNVHSVIVKHLQADAGAYAGGHDMNGRDVTWAGETWSYEIDNGEGHSIDGVSKSETLKTCDGIAVVEVHDSEAVIVYVDDE